MSNNSHKNRPDYECRQDSRNCSTPESSCVFALCGRVVGHDEGVRRIVGGMDPIPGLIMRVYVEIMTHTQLIHFNSRQLHPGGHQHYQRRRGRKLSVFTPTGWQHHCRSKHSSDVQRICASGNWKCSIDRSGWQHQIHRKFPGDICWQHCHHQSSQSRLLLHHDCVCSW